MGGLLLPVGTATAVHGAVPGDFDGYHDAVLPAPGANVSGVPGTAEAYDTFGATVSARDVNKDGRPELFVGAGGENNTTGAVWVLPGGTSRATATGSRLFTAPSAGLTQADSTLLGGNGLLWIVRRTVPTPLRRPPAAGRPPWPSGTGHRSSRGCS